MLRIFSVDPPPSILFATIDPYDRPNFSQLRVELIFAAKRGAEGTSLKLIEVLESPPLIDFEIVT